MISSPTILERVAERVKNNPDGLSFVFIQRHDEPEERLTWSQLWQYASTIAQNIELKDDANKTGILIFCANEKNFVLSLLAVWMRGAVAIPAVATPDIASNGLKAFDNSDKDSFIKFLTLGKDKVTLLSQ